MNENKISEKIIGLAIKVHLKNGIKRVINGKI
jgi:hypothetical protein